MDVVDPGGLNAPPEVLEREAQLQALLSSNDSLPPADDISDEEIDELMESAMNSKADYIPTKAYMPQKSRDPLVMLSEVLQYHGERKEVKIHTPIGVITLRALHVCVNQHSVGMILSKDDTNIQPEFGSELELTIDGRKLTVIYGGGFFTFNRIPITFLSFFRVANEDEEDEEVTPI